MSRLPETPPTTTNENQPMTPQLQKYAAPSYDPKYGAPKGTFLVRDALNPNAEDAILCFYKFEHAYDCVNNTMVKNLEGTEPLDFANDPEGAAHTAAHFDEKRQVEVNYVFESDYLTMHNPKLRQANRATAPKSKSSVKVTNPNAGDDENEIASKPKRAKVKKATAKKEAPTKDKEEAPTKVIPGFN